MDASDVLMISQTSTIHEWILDSASCFHICSTREIFDERSLCLANGTVHLLDCKDYGVEKVTLKMHNETHHTLMGVQYFRA